MTRMSKAIITLMILVALKCQTNDSSSATTTTPAASSTTTTSPQTATTTSTTTPTTATTASTTSPETATSTTTTPTTAVGNGTTTTDTSNSTTPDTAVNGTLPAQPDNTTQSNAAPSVAAPAFDYPTPSGVDTWSSQDLINNYGYSCTPIFTDFGNYYSNNCTDSRIQSLFNYDAGSVEYNEACISLVYDWSQSFSNYTCNNWFCNNQGQCSFTLDDSGFVTPACTCSAGYNGQNCMFTTQNYNYAKTWVNAVNEWVVTKTNNFTVSLIDVQSVKNLFDVLGQVLFFTTNANVNDLEYFGGVTTNIFNAILSANITASDSALSQEILDFVSEVLGAADSSLNIDPTDALIMSNTDSMNTTQYGYYSQAVNTTEDLVIAPIAAASRLRFLYDRYLAAKSAATPPKRTTTTPVNQASATLLIPKSATAQLNVNAKVSFTFVKDPKPYNQLNGPTISSQVVSISAQDANRNSYPYPTNADKMTITLPWSTVPYNNADYLGNCKVYAYNGKNWNTTAACSLTASSSNLAASAACNQFGTYGVACLNSQTSLPKKSTGSSFITLSSVLLGLFAVLLF